MKEFVITVFIALMLSCLFNSVAIWMGLLPSYPPYPYGSCIKDKIGEVKLGTKRQDDQIYPEIDITSRGARPSGFITEVNDTTERCSAEFPLAANN